MSDLRLAFRAIAKAPGFTGVVVLSLAIAIGAATAIFSVANAILLRSLDVPNPHELRSLRWSGTNLRIPSWSGGFTCYTPPAFFQIREQAAPVADVFAFVSLSDVVARSRSVGITTQGAMVSDNFFSGLAVRSWLGRVLVPGEDFAGSGDRVVLSHAFWEAHLDGDPDVIGEPITLNGRVFRIVGVLPPGFAGVQGGTPAAFFVPLSTHSPFLYRELTSDFHWYVRLMARLRADATDAQLQAHAQVAFAGTSARTMENPAVHIEPCATGEITSRADYRRSFALLLGVASLVILVACANLAGLSLARIAARQHEFAVRAALGATRWKLARQSLSENLLLAFVGAALGVIVAQWFRAGIAHLLLGSSSDLHYDVTLDGRVFAFAAIAAVVTALLSGIWPALRAGSVNAVDGLKSRGAVASPRLRTGRFLVGAQVMISLVLLVTAGLYLRTVANLARIDPGFDTTRLLLFQTNVRGSGQANAKPADYYARVQEIVATIPGVRAVSLVEFPLLSGADSTASFNSISGQPKSTGGPMEVHWLSVGESFFETHGVSISRGRPLRATDKEGAKRVIVVNQAFVDRYLRSADPIGATIPVWDATWEIVGVCEDVRFSNVRQEPQPTAYFPFRQRFYSRFAASHLRAPYFAVRTTVPPTAIAPAVRRAVTAIDSDVAFTNVRTQEEVCNQAIGRERLFAGLCGALAALALLLSAVGVYSLMAYNVARRRPEFGVRLAMGAQSRDIAAPVLLEAFLISAAGAVLGVPGALLTTRLIGTQLYGVKPNDGTTLVAAAAILVVATLFAAWMPARHAARTSPTEALRAE